MNQHPKVDEDKSANIQVTFASKRKKKKSGWAHGYLLVTPAMLLIVAIAIWPVLQSFYFSMFDLRLNDPIRSETHVGYSIDLERYLNSYPFLVSAIDNEEIAGGELANTKKQLQSINEAILSTKGIKANYEKVNDQLDNFENVDSSVSIVELDKETATSIRKQLISISSYIKELADQQMLNKDSKLLGLSSGLSESIIKPNFIGFKHYQENFTDSRMWKALSNTVIFTVISVGIELIIGLAIALLINKAFFGRGLIRASILIPWAIPTAVSALMWKFLYDGQNGVVAKIFESVGLVDNMAMLLTTNTGAFFSVIFTDVWKTTPYMALLLLAGLQTIPGALYEAASIDGASKWKQFTSITLPLLKSSIMVALLFRTLDAFRVFDLIYVLTGGGPANSTETISVLAYKVMFSQTNFGEGSALSVIVFICVALISTIYIKILGKDLLN